MSLHAQPRSRSVGALLSLIHWTVGTASRTFLENGSSLAKGIGVFNLAHGSGYIPASSSGGWIPRRRNGIGYFVEGVQEAESNTPRVIV